MGLFKDFKDDFSQAVNEMMPGADAPEKENKAEDLVVNTLGEDVDVKSEIIQNWMVYWSRYRRTAGLIHKS